MRHVRRGRRVRCRRFQRADIDESIVGVVQGVFSVCASRGAVGATQGPASDSGRGSTSSNLACDPTTFLARHAVGRFGSSEGVRARCVSTSAKSLELQAEPRAEAIGEPPLRRPYQEHSRKARVGTP